MYQKAYKHLNHKLELEHFKASAVITLTCVDCNTIIFDWHEYIHDEDYHRNYEDCEVMKYERMAEDMKNNY